MFLLWFRQLSAFPSGGPKWPNARLSSCTDGAIRLRALSHSQDFCRRGCKSKTFRSFLWRLHQYGKRGPLRRCCVSHGNSLDIHNLPKDKGSVDAIVHSTGGLVIRDWLQRYYEPEYAPIKHLVMLAPANFRLAAGAQGALLPGRVWKGFFTKQPEGEPFETGTHILKGLELASPYTWGLARTRPLRRGRHHVSTRQRAVAPCWWATRLSWESAPSPTKTARTARCAFQRPTWNAYASMRNSRPPRRGRTRRHLYNGRFIRNNGVRRDGRP